MTDVCVYLGCDAPAVIYGACGRHWAVVSGRTRRLVAVAARRRSRDLLDAGLTAAVREMNEHAHRLGVSA